VLDWLIVGGGIHGVHLGSRLVRRGVPTEGIRIVDPAPRLLHQWHRCVEATGMTYLRSPVVHHLDGDPYALKRFAETWTGATRPLFRPPYDRPSVELFAAHAAHVIERDGLADVHVQDRVEGVELSCDAAEVRLASGTTVRAERVVLAIGASEQPHHPAWARDLVDAPVHHVFGADGTGALDAPPDSVAIVGGGITAAQVALRLADGQRNVYLLMRHAPRAHVFDSDPGWIGPKHMRAFLATPDHDARRRTIQRARHRGSIPPRQLRRLKGAIDRGDVTAVQATVQRATPTEQGLHLDLGDAALPEVTVDAVFLATGFEARRPGGAWVDALRDGHELPCAACGYPIVDRALRWHPRVFVTGPLAELELGPVSRNIVGARRASERMMAIAGGYR